MWRYIQFLKIFLSFLLYGLLGPWGYFGFLVVSLVPTRDETGRARRFQWCIFRGFRLMHDWLRWVGLIRFQPRALAGALPTEPSLIVCNHPALTDVTVVMATFRNVVTVIRETTYDQWWLRPLLRAAGQISSPLSAAGVPEMNQEIARRLQQGFHVLVFPEGQRSPSNSVLREFSRAPFEAARLAGVPIRPLVIRTSPEWLSKNHGIGSPPPGVMEVTLELLPPISVADAPNSRVLRNQTVAVLADAIAVPALEAS